jgi:hypothetical protein
MSSAFRRSGSALGAGMGSTSVTSGLAQGTKFSSTRTATQSALGNGAIGGSRFAASAAGTSALGTGVARGFKTNSVALNSAVVVPAHSFPVHGASFCHPFFFPTCSPFFFSNWCWGFGFGVSVGFGFGYPYYGYPYSGYPYCGPYGYYPYSYYPYSRVCVGYPYAGYYYSYPYSYLDDCGYGCDFYDGYNVRFGYYRSSYYATCSGYGAHDWRHHHCHSCPCDVHGYHYYHVRDCPLCYPDGGSYVEHDVNVPEAVAGGAAVPQPEAPVQGAATPESSPEARTIAPEREESFFASLRPAQLSFAMGLIHFREGDYDQAAEDFYNSSVEDPSSRLVKVFLGVSLFAVGEYSFAAEYFRLGLDEWPAFTRHPWNVQRMYGNSADFTHQLATLHDAASMDPADDDAALVLTVLNLSSATAGSEGDAGASIDRVRSLSVNPVDRSIALDYQPRVEAAAPPAEAEPADLDPAVENFLATLEPQDVAALPIR